MDHYEIAALLLTIIHAMTLVALGFLAQFRAIRALESAVRDFDFEVRGLQERIDELQRELEGRRR